MRATYSPEDNKIRIYPVRRLDEESYQRVKDAGFKWAPRQGLFVAPMWTPGREDIAVELCGELEDEDTSLVDRAEERAERFEGYSERRTSDAEAARRAVHAIADHIPFGQPILVGHHSERRARKDAERITNGMHKAVKMWETATYWQDRAAGALRAAKYKERPDVRYRRIKGIESDRRKAVRNIEESEFFAKLWNAEGLTMERALAIANRSHVSRCFPLADFPRTAPASQYEGPMSIWSALDGGVITPEQAREICLAAHARILAVNSRWLTHYDNRLAYERAMLGENPAEKFDIQPGGRVLIDGEWVAVIRVNKKDGRIVSVRTSARFPVRGIEEVQGYKEPTPEDAAKVKKATALGPICNYPGEGFLELTKAEWDHRRKHSDSSFYEKVPARDGIAAHRRAKSFIPGRCTWGPVFITDAKRVDPPKIESEEQAEPVKFERQPAAPVEPVKQEPAAEAKTTAKAGDQGELFAAMRETLRQGVKVVTALQLFPTPAPLAARMVELASIEDGQRILEPSAGTARILTALQETGKAVEVVAVEINANLAGMIRARFPTVETVCADFLDAQQLGLFDSVLMNPPFSNAEDIDHITRAHSMLKPGGCVVAICANGPRQNASLRPLVEGDGGTWEVLPADTFKASGTLVSAVLLSWPA